MKVLFISAWYPNRYDEMAGLFVRKHAQAVSQFCEVEVLYSEHTVLGNLEVVLLLLGLLLFAKEALLFGLGVGIHLLNMLENDLGHVFTFRYAAPR